MLRLLIVDDEKNIRDSMKDFIPWSELGIDIVETAKNGLNALELIEQNVPDIMICDVRMPKMDGIKLASKVRETYPDIRIIFLSGYSDKEYLKSAIQLKAIDYIEKPLNPEEIKTAVRLAVSLINEGKMKSTDFEKLKKSADNSIYLIRQEIALELIQKDLSIEFLLEKYGASAFNFSGKDYFTVASIVLNWKPSLVDKEKKIICNNILKSLNSNLDNFSTKIISGFMSDNLLISIAEAKIHSYTPKSNNILEEVLAFLIEKAQNKFSVSIGCGKPVHNISMLPESYHSATAAANQQFYLGAGRVFYHSDTNNNSFKINKEDFEYFKELLRKDDSAGAEKYIRKLTEIGFQCKDSNIDYIRNIYFNLLIILFENSRELGLIDPAEVNETKNIWQEIYALPTLIDISEFIISNVKSVHKQFEESDIVSKKIYEVMQYIHEHYADKELTTKSIADQAYLSQTYLCAFFKKATKKTLNEFITEVRVGKAKELLRDTKIKLYEVAIRVGYSDANYFSTIFKKQTGYSPSDFKERV